MEEVQDAMSGSSTDRSDATGSSDRTLRTLFVNGESRTLEAPWTVTRLLEALGMGGRRVAVAVNREVVVRSRYGETELSEGDRIEILEAVGGG